MVFVATIQNQFAAGLGLIAAAIAVFGFIAHAPSALSGAHDRRLREATVSGGIVGLCVAVVVIVLSALMG